MNKPKRKGTKFESDVVIYLREHGFNEAERRALAGGRDLGDIVNAGNYVWECKATQKIELAQGIEETKQEQINADAKYGFLITKRRNKAISEAYATMTLKQLCDLLGEIADGADR